MKLIKLNNGNLRVESETSSFDGPSSLVTSHLVEHFGVDKEDLDFALLEMEASRHDVAHFGINYMFTHTSHSVWEKALLEECRAIQCLREEFECEYLRDPAGEMTRGLHQRLMSLYATFNVQRVLKVLNLKEDLAA